MDLDGLHWRPAGAETNTPAILVTHALSSFRDWTCIGLGAERPPRSRDDEFVSQFDTTEAAISYINAVVEDTLRVLDTATAPEWAEICWAESPDEPTPTRAYALVHAIEHLREHVGHLQLTRQLWDARA